MTSPVEPAEFDPKVTPSITADGKEWPIPELAPRQLRHIRSALFEMNSRLGKKGDEDPNASAMSAFKDLSDADFDRLVLKPIYWALTRAHPSLTEDAFLDMRMKDSERVTAWFIVRVQSGLFIFQADEEGDSNNAGEAPAA